MIGYHPDYEFLKSVGIQINTNEFGTAPMYNKETYETNIEELLHCGCDCCGNDANIPFLLKMVNSTVALLLKSMLAKK